MTNRSLARRPAALPLMLLVALVGVGSGGPVAAQDAIPLEPLEDPAYGLVTVVPADWTPLGGGLYARVPGGTDRVILAVQAASATPDQLWSSLLLQLGLDEAPEPSGRRTTDTFDWDLYQVTVPAPVGEVVVDVALTAADGTTYLVLLQAPRAASPTLREAVFLPAVDALMPLAPEPTVDPATLPYDSEAVSFPGGSPDVTLAGTLTRPRTPGPHPALVLLSGSGAQDRDESLRPIAQLKPFALLADALTRAGMAVLRYDDRGTAESTGDHASADLDDLTADAGAALAFLRTRSEVDPARIGLLGHSEGGVYAASLIEAGEQLAFVVAMAAPATNGVELLVAQNGALVRTSGGTEEDALGAEAFARELYPVALDGDMGRATALIHAYFESWYDRQPADVQAALGDREAFVQRQVGMQISALESPWFLDILRSDAGVGWEAASIPVLGVFGGKDVQVLADQNAPLMEAQLAGSDPASRVVVLPDANHLFQSAVTGGVAEYASLEPEFTSDFLPLVVGWVAGVVGLEPTESPGP